MYTIFKSKSVCCKTDIEYVKTKDVGYEKCKKCNKQCDSTSPRTKEEKFEFFLQREFDRLNYFEKRKNKSEINHQKMILIESIKEEFERIYLNKQK